jgi:hypothetical protein
MQLLQPVLASRPRTCFLLPSRSLPPSPASSAAAREQAAAGSSSICQSTVQSHPDVNSFGRQSHEAACSAMHVTSYPPYASTKALTYCCVQHLHKCQVQNMLCCCHTCVLDDVCVCVMVILVTAAHHNAGGSCHLAVHLATNLYKSSEAAAAAAAAMRRQSAASRQ